MFLTPLQREYVGQSENSRITFSFSLSCNTNYYGSNCNTYCRATNDNLGHYSCHSSTGAKLCLAGWSNPSGNCLTRELFALSHEKLFATLLPLHSLPHSIQAVCASNCNSAGGYCRNPGQCLCRSGWTGIGCHQCQPSSGCSMIGGFCNVPGECICRENYFGAHCEVDLIPCDRNAGGPCSQGMLCTNDGQGATYVTVQLAPLMWNVKLNVIPIHVCINPPVLLFRMGLSVSVLVDQGKSAIVNTTTVIHTLVRMVEHAWISWEGMSVSVLWDGLETDVNLTLMTVLLLHVRMVEHVLTSSAPTTAHAPVDSMVPTVSYSMSASQALVSMVGCVKSWSTTTPATVVMALMAQIAS
ncbi:Delta-like protein B [Geodia barretti]|uniref:Delta-like protein B n=2 Tax=Geodia barretti TaxID=519541 RepID=A0AA35WLW8_GEOBA|nr:Delta-like protein B [Geodia barretti]